MRISRLLPLMLAGFIGEIGSAKAQVIEIGEGGTTTVYSGPTQFTSAGGRPLRLAPVPRSRARRAPALAAEAAMQAGVSPRLVEAVAWRESGFRPRVISAKGAVGEMQLMPETARRLGVDPYNSQQNYRGGAAYLAHLSRSFGGDLVKVLAAYNAGPDAVRRYGGVPPFPETRAYVRAVLDRLGRIEGASALTQGTQLR
ncbi:MAG: lytic transglycosylase domain-containing protein [Pseudomonadota bacterium]